MKQEKIAFSAAMLVLLFFMGCDAPEQRIEFCNLPPYHVFSYEYVKEGKAPNNFNGLVIYQGASDIDQRGFLRRYYKGFETIIQCEAIDSTAIRIVAGKDKNTVIDTFILTPDSETTEIYRWVREKRLLLK